MFNYGHSLFWFSKLNFSLQFQEWKFINQLISIHFKDEFPLLNPINLLDKIISNPSRSENEKDVIKFLFNATIWLLWP